MTTATLTPTYYYPMAYGRINPDSPLWARLAANPNWVMEKKYNEIRCQIHMLDNQVMAVYDRHGEPLAYKLTDDQRLLLGGLDRGYCVYDAGLRDRMVPGYRGKLVLYDCLRYGGIPLTDTPYRHRLELLPVVETDRPLNRIHTFDDCDCVSRPEQFADARDWQYLIAVLVQDQEAEGVVLKNLDGMLKLSRSSNPKTYDILKWRFA